MKRRNKPRVGIIGCGNMGQALMKGLGRDPRAFTVVVYDKDRRKPAKAKKAYRVSSAQSLAGLIASCRGRVRDRSHSKMEPRAP